MQTESAPQYHRVINEITDLSWQTASRNDLVAIAQAYYYFSVQFRESLSLACDMNPDDEKLRSLHSEECDTDNLSPFPGIAEAGERMDHDEFMKRIVEMAHLDQAEQTRLQGLGEEYLAITRSLPPIARALSISSYEDGGLTQVFRAILSACAFDTLPLEAFRHFLVEHIHFDTDESVGHGALSRHFVPDDRVLPLWTAFRDLMICAVPSLAHSLEEVFA